MSLIKLKKILSFSSEDINSKSENLIDRSGKWIGSRKGDTKQYVKIELDEPSSIKQIDMENESSAFIEILVGNLNDLDEDFEVLLPATSFMSPNESKNSQNTNRLKIFTHETHLDEKLSEKKWEVVKIICTQPFNTNLQFGISFIKLYDRIVNENSREAAKLDTGIFSLKKEVSISEKKENNSNEERTESNFEKWKKDKTDNISDQNQNTKKSIDEKKVSKVNEYEKRDSDPKKPTPHQILKGVIFALSGFQNPLRSQIRDTGIKIGAKYRPDWTDDCTHLVCAFSNTPKAALVKKKGGIIVNKDWIFDCRKEKKKLDCGDYALEEDDSDDDSKPRKAARNAKKMIGSLNKKSEFDDSYDEEEAENSDDRDFIADSSEEEEEIMSSSSSEESFDSDGSNKIVKKSKKKSKKKIKSKKSKSKKRKSGSESETDLEEYKKKREKELAQEKKRKKNSYDIEKKKGVKYEDSEDDKKTNKKLKKSNSESSKTESNSDMDNNKSWELPNFLDDKKFFIDTDFEAKKRKQISKIIYAYGGEVSDYMAKDVLYVIADKKWNKDFDEAKEDNKQLKFIESDWLQLCHKRKKLIPFDVFEIVKE